MVVLLSTLLTLVCRAAVLERIIDAHLAVVWDCLELQRQNLSRLTDTTHAALRIPYAQGHQ